MGLDKNMWDLMSVLWSINLKEVVAVEGVNVAMMHLNTYRGVAEELAEDFKKWHQGGLPIHRTQARRGALAAAVRAHAQGGLGCRTGCNNVRPECRSVPIEPCVDDSL